MVKPIPPTIRNFIIKTIEKGFNLKGIKAPSKDLTVFYEKLESINSHPRSKIQNLPLSIKSIVKEESGKTFDNHILFLFTSLSLVLTILLMEGKSKDVDSAHLELPVMILYDTFLTIDDMATLDILKDKNFYEYLLQSLTDHYVKFIGCENVTWRPEFTEEFFASYWLELMKLAGFNNVPEVTLEDQKRHERIINGFDSIHRSLFEVCESRIDLRVTTLFSFSGKELCDEEQISYRTAFMLVLLFVSEWVADQKDGCPHIALKEPKARLVHACFNKLFKDIYYGNNEGFKRYIFDIDKEASPLSPLPFASPNRSLNNSFNLSCIDVTPEAGQKEREPESLLDPLSETNAALMKAINLKTKKEKELESEFKALQKRLNATAAELEKANNVNADLMKEKENNQESFLKAQNELDELLRQQRLENEKILREKQSWVEGYNQLQMDHDACMDRLSSADIENDRLKEEIEDLMKVINSYARNGEEKETLLKENESLKDAVQQLQMDYDACLNRQIGSDIENARLKEENEDLVKVINNYATNGEEKENLLNENNSLKDAIQQLQMEYDSYKFEVDKLKVSNEAMKEEKETLQQNLDGKLLEMENIKKVYANSLKEIQRLQRDLLNASNIVIQKEEEIKNLFNEILSLNDDIQKVQKEFYLCNAELANVKLETQKLAESNDELTKNLNLEKKNMETFQRAFDAQTYELEKVNKINADVINEKNFLQQELNRKNRESENFISVITQKEAEYNELLETKESLIGTTNKYQNEQDVYKEEMSNALNENEILKERVEELLKRDNRITRDKQKLEEEKKAVQEAFNGNLSDMNKLKELLSNMQAEFCNVATQLRDLYLIKSDIQEELNAFKAFFDDANASNEAKFYDLNTLFNDFSAERLHNISLTNQIEALQDEMNEKHRSRTPSLHDEGIIGRGSHLLKFNGNGPELFDDENMCEILSEPFDEEDKLDSGIDSNEQTPEISTVENTSVSFVKPVHQSSSSSFSRFFIFLFSLFLFFVIHIYWWGAIIPSWVRLDLHHDHLPPQ